MADNPRKVEAERPTKLVDYHTNPQYDHRVILFYDVLGWRNEIEIAIRHVPSAFCRCLGPKIESNNKQQDFP